MLHFPRRRDPGQRHRRSLHPARRELDHQGRGPPSGRNALWAPASRSRRIPGKRESISGRHPELLNKSSDEVREWLDLGTTLAVLPRPRRLKEGTLETNTIASICRCTSAPGPAGLLVGACSGFFGPARTPAGVGSSRAGRRHPRIRTDPGARNSRRSRGRHGLTSLASIESALQEALRSDGTPFVTVSDSDIAAGRLRNAGRFAALPHCDQPGSRGHCRQRDRAPARICRRRRVPVRTNSSSFTRRPDGTAGGDFALASEMGVHTANRRPLRIGT